MSNKRNHYYASNTSAESTRSLSDTTDSFEEVVSTDVEATEETVIPEEEINTDTPVTVESEEKPAMTIGVVANCHKLNIRPFPSIDNTPVCVVSEGDPLVLNKEKSTDGWYAVYTEAGVEGFCMKQYVEIIG